MRPRWRLGRSSASGGRAQRTVAEKEKQKDQKIRRSLLGFLIF